MTPSWWVVVGALGGAFLLGGAALLARVFDPEPWNLYALFVGLGVGLVLGGLLGSRAALMARGARTAFGALLGAALLAAVGGSAFLFLGGAGDGLARFEGKNFVIEAIVGGLAGLLIGAVIGARTTRSDAGPPRT